jgi:hypothetical protein
MRYLFIILPALVCFAPIKGYAQRPEVTIDSITSNVQIEGTVRNLDAARIVTSCVVVYVHTDFWHIHPFANGGVGKSFARIGRDGSWSIPTEKRDFPADQVAALVIPSCPDRPERPNNVPAQTSNVATINHIAIEVKSLSAPDLGKL